MLEREELIELLSRYFQIGDSYAYNLTRVKTAFDVGTMSLDDFEEFDEETVADIADFLLDHGVIIPPCKVGDVVYWYNWGGNITEAKVVGCGFTAKIEGGNEYDVRYKDLGKTVFLTREEAEAALAERRKA